MSSLSVVFMGTPEFAVASLQAIHSAGFPVTAVVTVPDKPSGRGLRLQPSPVKTCAQELGLPLLQPISLKDKTFINELSMLQPDVIVVVAFRKLPDEVISIPARGAFNLHASLLPQYRGAAPIHHAIINGENKTGLTTFFLNSRIDEGSIILTRTLTIGDDENVSSLHDRLMLTGADLVVETLRMIDSGPIETLDQNSLIDKRTNLKAAPKLTREFCRIKFERNATDVYNHIRGLSHYPGAHTVFHAPDGEQFPVKIISASLGADHYIEPGKIFTDGKTVLMIGTLDTPIVVNELQLAGKKTMNVRDFLRGFSLNSLWWAG